MNKKELIESLLKEQEPKIKSTILDKVKDQEYQIYEIEDKKIKERENIRKKIEEIEKKLKKIIDVKMEKNESYFTLLELLYKNSNVVSSLSKDTIENIPQENERILEKNDNKNSKKVNEFTLKLEKKITQKNQDKVIFLQNHAMLTNPIIQSYYPWLIRNKNKVEKVNSLLDSEINQLKKAREKINQLEYEMETDSCLIFYMKLKQLEIKNKLEEEMNIQSKLRGNYVEKCSFEKYLNNTYYNLGSLKEINLKKLCRLVFKEEKIEKKHENRIRRFLFKQKDEKYSKIQNVFRIKECYATSRKISEIDGDLEVPYSEIIGALKEFVSLKTESYIPLNKEKEIKKYFQKKEEKQKEKNIRKKYEKSPYVILKDFEKRNKISEAYDYYIFLKLMRGISRENGISCFFEKFHRLDVEYNKTFLSILQIYNCEIQRYILEKKLDTIHQSFLDLSIDVKQFNRFRSSISLYNPFSDSSELDIKDGEKGCIQSIINEFFEQDMYWFKGESLIDEIVAVDKKSIRLDVNSVYSRHYGVNSPIQIIDTPDGIEAINLDKPTIRIKASKEIKKIVLVLLNYIYLHEYVKQRDGEDNGVRSVLRNEEKFHSSSSFKALYNKILSLKRNYKEFIDLENFNRDLDLVDDPNLKI